MSRYTKRVGAIVLTGDGQYLANRPGDHCTFSPYTRPGVTDPASVLGVVGELSARPEITVLIDEPGAMDRWANAENAIRAAGWTWHGTIADWTRYRAPHEPIINIGIVPAMDPRRISMWDPELWGAAGQPAAPDVVAKRLSRYHAATGAAWYINAGVSGCNSIRELFTARGRGAQPFWGTRQSEPLGNEIRGAGDLQSWERDPDLTERAAKWVHLYDANRARLAAAGNAELPWTELLPTGPIPFDATLGGYWQVRYTPGMECFGGGVEGGPPLFDPDDVDPRDQTVWLTTPVLKDLSLVYGNNPEIIDSRTEPEYPNGKRRPSKRLLRAWAKSLDEATRAAATNEHRLELVLKLTYKITFGMMAKKGGSIYRWDWADLVLDQGRVNLLRRVWQIHQSRGVWPLRVHTDCLYYASDQDDPRDAFPELPDLDPLGRANRLGTYKLATIPMDEWLDGRRKP